MRRYGGLQVSIVSVHIPYASFTFYTCLRQTGQVVRYSSLHRFTLVGRDVELDKNIEKAGWVNKYNIGLSKALKSFLVVVVVVSM